MTDFATILVEQADGVVTITLNRPEKYNALNHNVAKELMAVLKQAERDATMRCLVLTGAGKGFCAGQDLREAAKRDDSYSFRDGLNRGYNRLVIAMRALEKPIIVAVNGACAGAGLGLALAGDIRYAAEDAQFLTAFIGIGLAPDTGVSYWLPRLIGPARAAEMLFSNERIDGSTAAQIGMVNKAFPVDQLMDETMQLAYKLAASPPIGLALSKRALNRSLGISFAETLDYEAHLQEVAGHTADYKEGAAAFREKRSPHFQGK